jgi:hypothetical protein
VFERLNRKIKGFRTFIGAGALGLVGMLSILGELDLTPLVKLFVRNDDALPLALLGISIFFGVMRYLTDTTPGGNLSAHQGSPIYKGVDDGV